MTYRIPPLNGLRAFEAAARNLSFKLAANELGVTAGAVSQQVKKLEVSLGIALFRRLPHGLLLTEEGETYYPRISRALEDLTEATEAIAPDLNARKFSLGLSPKAASLLPEKWPRHSTALDNFISSTSSTADMALILDNKLDCLVRTGQGPAGGLSAITIVRGSCSDGDEPVQFICRNGLIECRQSKAIIADLKACLA